MNYKWIILAIGILLILLIVYKKKNTIMGWLGMGKKIKTDSELPNPTQNIQRYEQFQNDEPPENEEEYIVLEIAISPEENKEKVVGELFVKLHDDICPKTCENFRALSKIEYKGCVMHRLIKGFMVQTGDYENHNGTGGKSIWGPKFPDENFILKHDKRGVLAMANSGENTNGSQFYVTFAPTPHLDGKHVVFGEVVKGFEVLDAIENMNTNQSDEPVQLLYIRNTRVTNNLE